LCGNVTSTATSDFQQTKSRVTEASRLWPVIPDITRGAADNMPPTTLRFAAGGRNVANDSAPACGAIFLVTRREIPVSWEHARSTVPIGLSRFHGRSQYYSQLNISSQAYQQNKFYSTTSYQSRCHCRTTSWAEYHIQQPNWITTRRSKPVSFLYAIVALATIIVKRSLEILQGSIRIDSLSQVFTMQSPRGLNL
jgi:hypothetical protein